MAEPKKPRPYTKQEEQRAAVFIRWMSALNAWIYRATGGRLGGTWLRGAPICLLESTGRKSGQRRTAPLLFLEDGDDVILVASKGGMPSEPMWSFNLKADPDCWIEIGSRKRTMRARLVSEDEKMAYWPRLIAVYPDWDDYQARSPRIFPVFVLTPR
jgi:deazaflavin-dependent oxidoreductase (nitroreductase family)